MLQILCLFVEIKKLRLLVHLKTAQNAESRGMHGNGHSHGYGSPCEFNGNGNSFWAIDGNVNNVMEMETAHIAYNK